MSKAITIVVLTCFLVLGAAATAILGRDSVPSVSAEMITQAPAPKPLAANRAAKADRLVPTLALASAAIEPVQVSADKLSQTPVLTEPLRQAFAAATPSDFPMPKASVNEAPAAAEAPAAEAPVKPKVVVKPQPQKSYSLLSDVQIAGIRDRLKLSSSQEYYWPLGRERAAQRCPQDLGKQALQSERAGRANRSELRRGPAVEVGCDAAVVPVA
ncbi:hypothetical protein ACVWXO_003367 [Bradyrhizobium sp. LM2.7]